MVKNNQLSKISIIESESLKDGQKVKERRNSSKTSQTSIIGRKIEKNKQRVEEHIYTIKDLFKTHEIRILTLKMSYLYFAAFALYYAVFMIDIEGIL